MFTSYKTTIILNFILVAIIPLLLFGLVMATLTSNALERDAATRSLMLVQSLAAEIEVFLEQPEIVLRQIVMILENSKFPNDSLFENLLQVFTETHTQFDRILITNRNGTIMFTTPESEQLKGFSMSRQPFFQEVVETGNIFWGSPFIDLKTMQMTLPVSMPFHDGVVVGYIDLGLLRSITQRIYKGGRGFTFITDHTGVVIAHPNEQVVIQRVNQKYLDIVRYGLEGKTETLIYEHHREKFIGSVTQVKNIGWTVVVTQPIAEAFALSLKLKRLLWISCGAALVLACCLALWNSGRILRPLLSLAEDTRKVANGDYTFILSGEHPYKELNALVYDFQLMIKAIQDREQTILQNNLLLEEAVQKKQQEMETLFEKMLRQEKLVTIGLMAGSIAHELRNPLGAVKNSVFFLKRLWQKQQLNASNLKVQEHLDLIDTELDTSEHVIAYLLQMTRMKPPKKEHIDLRPIIADAVERCHLPKGIHCTIELYPEPFLIWTDPVQLRQVFINLLTNAIQAIEGDGNVTIRATRLTKDTATRIEIENDGADIAPDVLSQVFEPLYTTKAIGTGLGLSICKHIIENHQGEISIRSKKGQGTTVTIVLPDQE